MYPSVFGSSWKALEHELSQTLHSSIQGYWTRWSAAHDTNRDLPQPQVCLACLLGSSLFTGTLAVQKLHTACIQGCFCMSRVMLLLIMFCLQHSCYGPPVLESMLHQGDIAPPARPSPPALPAYLGSIRTLTPTLAS